MPTLQELRAMRAAAVALEDENADRMAAVATTGYNSVPNNGFGAAQLQQQHAQGQQLEQTQYQAQYLAQQQVAQYLAQQQAAAASGSSSSAPPPPPPPTGAPAGMPPMGGVTIPRRVDSKTRLNASIAALRAQGHMGAHAGQADHHHNNAQQAMLDRFKHGLAKIASSMPPPVPVHRAAAAPASVHRQLDAYRASMRRLTGHDSDETRREYAAARAIVKTPEMVTYLATQPAQQAQTTKAEAALAAAEKHRADVRHTVAAAKALHL